MLFNAFRSNPHDDARYSRERKIRFGYDNSARLKGLDPVRFAGQITATDTACSNLSIAMGRTGTAVGIGRGQTYGTDAALQAYREVVGSKYNVVRDRLGKKSAIVLTVFGSSIQRFTTELNKSNADARMEELDKLLDAHKTDVGTDVVEAIGDAVEAYTGKRTIQREKLGLVGTTQVAAQAAEAALDQQLWINACEVVLAYPSHSDDDQARRAAAANYSLLERPDSGGPLHLKGKVPPGAVLNLLAPDDDEILLPDTVLTFTNAGKSALRFVLMKAPGEFDESAAITVGPGETLVRKAADLGDVTLLAYLNVFNPSPAVGAYDVAIG